MIRSDSVQESVVVIYNWLPLYTDSQISPHSWIVDYMADMALPVNFVGTSTKDRRTIYPMKEVSFPHMHHVSYVMSHVSCGRLPCNAATCNASCRLLTVY